MVVIEGLINSSKHGLSHLLAPLKSVLSITENLWLNYWDQASSLTGGSISGINSLRKSLYNEMFTHLAKTLAFSMIAR